MIRNAVFLAALLAAGGAAAHGLSPVDGNKLMSVCTAKEAAACEGYILGVVGMLSEERESKSPVCISPSVTPAQLHDVLVKFLRAHPESRSLKGAGLTVLALHQAFPCGK